MGSLMTEVRTYFDRIGWRVEQRDDKPVLYTKIVDRIGKWDCQIHVSERPRLIELVSWCPLNVPEHRMTEGIELVARLNDTIRIGHFVLDLNDGGLLFKTTLSADGQALDEELLHNMIRVSLTGMRACLPWLARVFYCEMEPQHAVAGFRDSQRRLRN